MDRRAGEVAAIIMNVHRDRKKRTEPYTWEDVFPEHVEPKKPKTPDELLEKALMINSLLGGKDLRRKDA